ncbi:MAG: FliM/FliN family flagellar motor switch protein [Alphaproteobacteria bacterium]
MEKIFNGCFKKQSLSGDEITVDISVTLGTADLRVQQLLKLGRGAVVELDRNVNDYVDIYANNILIGHGEVVITENETIGISVTDIVKKSKR